MMKLKYLLITFIFSIPSLLSAQKGDATQSFLEHHQIEIILTLATVICLVLLLAVFVMYKAMQTVLKTQLKSETEKDFIEVREGKETVGFWNRFNKSVPVAKEETVILDHEYDGIRELDNQLPSWWVYGFYASIIFSVIYLFNYHVIGSGLSQTEEYEMAMQKADQEVSAYLASLDNLVDEKSVELSTNSVDINAGKAIFESNCAVCHANDGGGGVGPNFTDKYWIHGGDIKSIFKIIKYGVPSKGMISWKTQLSPQKIMQVSSYIYMMEGQPADAPKNPQGELFERAESVEKESDPSGIDDEADLKKE